MSSECFRIRSLLLVADQRTSPLASSRSRTPSIWRMNNWSLSTVLRSLRKFHFARKISQWRRIAACKIPTRHAAALPRDSPIRKTPLSWLCRQRRASSFASNFRKLLAHLYPKSATGWAVAKRITFAAGRLYCSSLRNSFLGHTSTYKSLFWTQDTWTKLGVNCSCSMWPLSFQALRTSFQKLWRSLLWLLLVNSFPRERPEAHRPPML